jgi:hypothetical protein
MRRPIAAALVAAGLVAGCARPAPPTASQAFDLLKVWDMSAQVGTDGSVVRATYDGWPLPAAPRVFACSSEPDEVFAGPPTLVLVIEADPSCREFQTRLDDGHLEIRLDRAGLPPALAAADSWKVAFAAVLDGGTWDVVTTLPVIFPTVRPQPAPSG